MGQLDLLAVWLVHNLLPSICWKEIVVQMDSMMAMDKM